MRKLLVSLVVLGAACGGAPVEERPASGHGVSLEGQPNLRDLGGYRTADDRIVIPGQVFRSGSLAELTDADLTVLTELGIRIVVDLRADEEIARAGAARLPSGATLVRLPMAPSAVAETLNETVFAGTPEIIARDLIEQTNRTLVRDSATVFGELLTLAADAGNRPLVFQTSDGVHRAGLAAASLLMALGVPRNTIEADYLATNEFLREHNQDQVFELNEELARAQGAEPDDIDMTNIDAILSLRSAHLDAAYDEIESVHGGVDAYLADGLGLDATDLENLRSHLLSR